MGSREARYVNIVLGIWLFISAFVWHHSRPLFMVSWITGIVIALVALTSIGAPRTRFVNLILGIWLIISAFAFPHYSTGTVWNNVIVGIVVGWVALVGPVSTATQRPVRSAG